MKTKIWRILVLLVLVCAGVGTYLQITKPSPEIAAAIVTQSVVDAGITKIPYDCIDAYLSGETFATISFVLHEKHSVKCGGDPNTSPRITIASLNFYSRKLTADIWVSRNGDSYAENQTIPTATTDGREKAVLRY